MTTHQAISKKHQAKVTRLIAWEFKRSQQVNDENYRAWEKCFDKICDIKNELPKREVAAVDKYLLQVRGY